MSKRGGYNLVKINTAWFKSGFTPWNKGIKTSVSPWNKGLTVSDPRVRKNIDRMVKTVTSPGFKRPLLVVTPESHVRRRAAKLGDKNPAKRLDVRDKIRCSVLRAYAEHPEILSTRRPSGYNQFSTGYTSIERCIADELDRRSIPYEHNIRIGRYFPDFRILGNVIIECDGEYWHKNDNEIRESYLHSEGYFTFHLKGKRILASASECIDMILAVMNDQDNMSRHIA